MPHASHTGSAALLGRRFARLGALALLSVILYEVAANLAVRRALGALEQGDLSMRYDTAYTFIPGRIVVRRLRVTRSAQPAWSMTAERLELRLALMDFFRALPHVQHAHVTSVTLSAARAPLALRTSSTGHTALSAASISGGARERGQSLWVALVTGTARQLEVSGARLERGVQLEVRGLSTSGAALHAARASLRLHETALAYDGVALATVKRGEIRSTACGSGSAELREADCRVELEAELVPAASVGLTSPQPIKVQGRLESAQGGHARAEIGLKASRAVTLRAGGRSWELPRGFSAQLGLSGAGELSGSVRAPELSASDHAAPLSVRLRVDSASVSFAAPVVFDGALELSGTELNSLLKLLGLPESVGYMLSQLQYHPFELTADVQRDASELWLRNLVLISGGARMEGALELAGAVRHGALLVTMGRSTLGVQFGGRGAGVALSADRAWLRREISKGSDR